MGLLEIILIAIGLSMDAFAVSVTLGLSVSKPKIQEILIPGLYFGFFQMFMSLIGYYTGTFFAAEIHNLDHWIAFILLGCIGGKMIKESFSKENEQTKQDSFQYIKMLFLAIATSIDALAVGVTFAFFEVRLFATIIIIGLTTFCISVCGVKIGNLFGSRCKSKAEFFGGVILILLGLKILIEHLAS